MRWKRGWFEDIYYFDRQKKVIFLVNDFILTIIDDLDLRKLDKNLTVKSSDVLIEGAKDRSERVELSRSIRIKIIVDSIN